MVYNSAAFVVQTRAGPMLVYNRWRKGSIYTSRISLFGKRCRQYVQNLTGH